MTRYYAKDPTELGLSVSAMVWRGHEILLMRRSDNGHWGLPGGFVELGESVSDAARREVFEETGWTVELGRLIGVYSDPATQVVDYLPSLAEGSVLPFLAEGSSSPSLAEGSRVTEGGSAEAEGSLMAAGVGGRQGSGRGRVQVVNLCFRAEAMEQGEPTTPDETLEMGFFAADALPSPFVPIHTVRIEDGLAGRDEAVVR